MVRYELVDYSQLSFYILHYLCTLNAVHATSTLCVCVCVRWQYVCSLACLFVIVVCFNTLTLFKNT